MSMNELLTQVNGYGRNAGESLGEFAYNQYRVATGQADGCRIWNPYTGIVPLVVRQVAGGVKQAVSAVREITG